MKRYEAAWGPQTLLQRSLQTQGCALLLVRLSEETTFKPVLSRQGSEA